MKPLIAVSGRNGQLGWELERLSTSYPEYDFIFCGRDQLDITDEQQLRIFFDTHKPSVFINCAAYTAVDKAETEQEAAYKTNASALSMIALECRRYDTLLIGFSTDYVFNGNGTVPYRENDPVDPINYYGYTKLLGEQLATRNWEKTIIIRASWVYSSHGNNFVKTMLRLMSERTDINVVNDQIGSPTYAADLAEAVMQIVVRNEEHGSAINGIFHFSNQGITSWFEFASAIKHISGLDCNIHPIPTTAYPTPARRPHYTVLDTTKIQSVAGIHIKNWQDSLAYCLHEITGKDSKQ